MEKQQRETLKQFEDRLQDHFKRSFNKWDTDMTKQYTDVDSIPMLKVMGKDLDMGAAGLVRYYFDRKIHSCWLLLQGAFDLIASRNIGSTQVAMFPVLRAEIEQLAKISWIFGETLTITKEEGISKFSAKSVGKPGEIIGIFERTAKLELCEILYGFKEEELFIDDPKVESRLPNMIDAKLTTSLNVIKGLYEDFDLSSHSQSYKDMYKYVSSKTVFGMPEPTRTKLVEEFIDKYYSMSNVDVKSRSPYSIFSFLSHSPDYAILQYSKLETIGDQKVLAVSLHPSILDNLIMAQTFLINVVCWNYLVYGLDDDYFCKEVIKHNRLRNEFIDALQIET